MPCGMARRGGGGKEDRNQYGIQKAGECMDILNERKKMEKLEY